MNMIHRFMGCIREYKKPTILTLLCMVGEVAIEVLIPFFTANLVNEIKGGAELSGVVRVGLGLILMSLVSLGCGALGGLYGSRAPALPKTSATMFSPACRASRLKISTNSPPPRSSRA